MGAADEPAPDFSGARVAPVFFAIAR